VRVRPVFINALCASVARAAIEVHVREIERARECIGESESMCVREKARVRVSLIYIDTFRASVARAAIEVCVREIETEGETEGVKKRESEREREKGRKYVRGSVCVRACVDV